MPCLVEVYLLIYGRATEVGRTYLLVHRASLKFVYSEKTTKFCEISTLLLSTVHTDKSKVNISQNFVAFLEYMNFKEKNGKKWDIELEINVLRRLKCMSANPQKAIYFQYLNIQRAFYIHQMVLLNPVFILVAEHSIIFVEKLITIVVKTGL